MSDSSDSMKSRGRGNPPRRDPATIDLSATTVRSEPPADASGPQSEGSVIETSPHIITDAAGSSEAGVRPTPDEVIPSDDARPEAADAPLSEPQPRGFSTVPPISPPGPRRNGFGFPALLAAGVVGGLVGAGASTLAERWWRPQGSAIDARLAQLEQRAAAPQTALGPVENRIGKLEIEAKALADRLAGTQALAERGAKQAQEALERPPPKRESAGVEAAASASALADLATRLGGLEKQVQERTQAGANVQERVTSLQDHAQANANAAQALERRLADQDQRLAALAKQLSERRPDAMAASLRVTLADRLGDALQDGAPVGQILTMLRRLEVKPEALRPLEPYAQNGAPTAAALAQEFKPLGQRIIAESRPPAGEWDERLWRMLDKVVTVRALKDAKDVTVPGLVARIENALGRGAYKEAVAAWDALPEPARRPAADWSAKLKQRSAAEAASQTIYADALSAIEATTR